MRVLLIPRWGQSDDHLTTGFCPFHVIGRGKSEAHRRMEASRGHGHLECHLDCEYMKRATEDRELPILVGKFSKDRWLVARNKKCDDTQHRWIVDKLVHELITSSEHTQVVMSDQGIFNLTIELHGVEGLTVVSEESSVGASVANAIEKKEVPNNLSICSRLCATEFSRWNPTVECAMMDASSRKIMVLDTSAVLYGWRCE